MFGIVDKYSGIVVAMYKTERGAKCAATRGGYFIICKISPFSGMCYALQEKKGGKWREV